MWNVRILLNIKIGIWFISIRKHFIRRACLYITSTRQEKSRFSQRTTQPNHAIVLTAASRRTFSLAQVCVTCVTQRKGLKFLGPENRNCACLLFICTKSPLMTITKKKIIPLGKETYYTALPRHAHAWENTVCAAVHNLCYLKASKRLFMRDF